MAGPAVSDESQSDLASGVDVWLAAAGDACSAEELAAAERLLSPDERARREAFRFAKDRAVFAIARSLLRTRLSRYARVAPEAWRFVTNAHGCPRIAAGLTPLRLRFNVSHTDGLVACAVTLDRDVGIDVERSSRTIEDVLALAARFFAPTEHRALLALPPNGRHDAFLRYWTLKEAYIKAREMGLAVPLRDFSFGPEGSTPAIHFEPALADDPGAWQFLCVRPTAEHVLALGVRRGRGPDLQIRLRWAETAQPSQRKSTHQT